MKHLKLVTIIATAILMASIFAVIPAFSTQPPLKTDTYLVGTIGQPSRLDPARAYDTASGELIQNVAQTLIWWNDKPVINFTSGVGHNVTVAEYANLDSYGPVLATALPTIVNNYTAGNLNSGLYYTFTINTNAMFQPWVGPSGTVPARNITAADVIYSFRRQMVYQSPASPVWMWFQPAFVATPSGGFSDYWFGGPFASDATGTFLNATQEAIAGQMISSWCYAGPGPNDVSFHFQQPWSTGILNQIFAQTWGSVVEPEWVQAHGGWDGLFTAGWSANYCMKPTYSYSEIDMYKDPAVYGVAAGSKYPSSNPHINEIMGTGPYLFTSWDQVQSVWRIDAWNSTNSLDGSTYWANPTWTGQHILTVIEKGINSWPTRKMLLLEGEFDVAVVPRANMYDLLLSTYTPIAGLNLAYNIAALSNDMLFFCLNVTAASPYQTFLGPPGAHTSGVESAFFANDHVRRAFAWAINYTQYINDAYFGEGLQQASWWVDGLSPPTYKNTALVLRNLDLTQMQNELNQAIVDGQNVSQTGFDVTLVYNSGNDQRRIAMQLIANAFTSLGSKYHVTVGQLDWPTFLNDMYADMMPGYCLGWLADFADPHDFAQPYMQSTGNFPLYQAVSIPPYNPPVIPADQIIIDNEIVAAVIDSNVTNRGLEYKDLQARFYNDAITLPLVQPVGRRFARDWVQGWYYNALFPGLYAYDLYKAPVSLSNVDIDMTSTVTPATPPQPIAYTFHSVMENGAGDANPRYDSYSLHVTYATGAIANLYVAVGLSFLDAAAAGGKEFSNSTYVIMQPGTSQSVVMLCGADGTYATMSGNSTGITHNIAGEAYPFASTANDTNLANNVQGAGAWIGKTLPGDITGNGLVDIYDAIKLAAAFGSHGAGVPTSSSKATKTWNADADLNNDKYVDIYDAIILAGHFNAHVP